MKGRQRRHWRRSLAAAAAACVRGAAGGGCAGSFAAAATVARSRAHMRCGHFDKNGAEPCAEMELERARRRLLRLLRRRRRRRRQRRRADRAAEISQDEHGRGRRDCIAPRVLGRERTPTDVASAMPTDQRAMPSCRATRLTKARRGAARGGATGGRPRVERRGRARSTSATRVRHSDTGSRSNTNSSRSSTTRERARDHTPR